MNCLNHPSRAAAVLLIAAVLPILQPTHAAPRTDPVNPMDTAIKKGFEYLLKTQGKNGSWGRDLDVGRQGIEAVMGITAIAAMAMKSHEDAKIDDVAAAMDRARKYLGQIKDIKGVKDVGWGDFRYWNYSFTLLHNLHLYRQKPSEALKSQMEKIIQALADGQNGGSWLYTNQGTASFLSATCLIALLEARAAGLKVPDAPIDQGIKTMKSIRSPKGTFRYIVAKDAGLMDSEIGSCARNLSNELSLYLAGESDKKKLEWAVTNFFHGRHELEAVRKTGAKSHTGKYKIAPYYHLYGHFYAIQVLHLLDKEARISIDKEAPDKTSSPQECIELIKTMIAKIQKPDGSWVDAPPVGSQYGTAMALLIMSGQSFIGTPGK